MVSKESLDFVQAGETTKPAHILEIVKQEMHEMSAMEVKMVDLGTLSGSQNETLWRGAISLKKRLESGELNQAEVDERIAKLNEFFVGAAPGAAKRCVDGSTIEGYDDNDPAWFGRLLGPQIQGGTVDEAVSARLVKGVDTDATLEKDMDEHVMSSQSKFKPGDHTDDHANEQTTGCGAIQGQKNKLKMYNDPEAAPLIKSTTQTILSLVGKKPKAGVFEKLQSSAKKLLDLPSYLPGATEILNKIRSYNPDGVEKLIRPHGEVSLTINFVRGTTFHRDHYNAQTDSKVQNFNLDAWAILEEFDEETAYALIADAVATVMDLTDGSLRLFARLPNGQPAEAA